MIAKAVAMVRRRRQRASRVTRLYSVRIGIENAGLLFSCAGALAKRGTTRSACMIRRLGRNVRSVVNGTMPTVTNESRTLNHRAGGA